MRENNIEIDWNKKPSSFDDNNNFISNNNQQPQPQPQPINQSLQKVKSNNEFSEEWLKEIQNARNTKVQRSNLNPVDIVIIKKLFTDNCNNKNSISISLQVNYNLFIEICNYFVKDAKKSKTSSNIKEDETKDETKDKSENKQRYQSIIDNIESNFSKLSNDFLNYSNSNFIDEYNKIKKEIDNIIISNNDKKLAGLKAHIEFKKANRFKPDEDDINTETSPSSKDSNDNKANYCKFTLKTIINILKDKGNLSYTEIAKKYTDNDGNQATLFDIQNICNKGHSYVLTEDDFTNRSDMTFEEYTKIRELKVGNSSVRAMNKAKVDESGVKKYTEQELLNNIKNATSKRGCHSDTMIDIFKDKYSILNALKTSLKYKNKKGDSISEAIVKQIWCGDTKLYEVDFENRTDITYQQYLEDVVRPKTEFSRILEYQDKLKNLQDGIENGTIKSLTRTHISVVNHCGYGDGFIEELKEKIKKKS
jgi:hypothetical protein